MPPTVEAKGAHVGGPMAPSLAKRASTILCMGGPQPGRTERPPLSRPPTSTGGPNPGMPRRKTHVKCRFQKDNKRDGKAYLILWNTKDFLNSKTAYIAGAVLFMFFTSIC